MPVNWLWARPLIRFTSLRRISIAGGTTTRPINDSTGSCVTITTIRLISSSTSRPTALISRVSTSVMDFAPGGQPRQEFGRMPLGKEPDAFAHQLGEQPPLVVGENGVADLGQDHGVAVGRHDP